MPGANADALSIQNRRKIVRVNVGEIERNDSGCETFVALTVDV